MSNTRNPHKLSDKSRTDLLIGNENHGKDELRNCSQSGPNYTYAVTVSQKPIPDEEGQCSSQKSFISIHSTDHPFLLNNIENPENLADCNVEVLTVNDVFPSTSEDSLSNDDSPKSSLPRKRRSGKGAEDNLNRTTYAPSNSKSSTVPREKNDLDGQASGYSDFDIPKSTLYVVGSNPGEPKMFYPDPPKKISKTMKKFLRNIDKQKNDHSKGLERAISKLTTMRGILKDGRCGPECTGDSAQGGEQAEELKLHYPMDFEAQGNYAKQNPDKNVTFNTQVVIIHFTGDLCLGQSVETLSKEKDQQARNSELRKTFASKYNEFWPTKK